MSTRGRNDDDFEREIQAHLEIETDRLIADGMNPDDAREAARRAFGGVLVAREQFHESRRPRAWIWLEQFAQDIRYAWRGLLRSPAFLATTVVTLAVALSLVTVSSPSSTPMCCGRSPCTIPTACRRSPGARQKRAARDSGGATTKSCAPGRICSTRCIAERGRAVVSDARRLPLSTAFVSGNYFDALGIANRMRLGRGIAEFDAARRAARPSRC